MAACALAFVGALALVPESVAPEGVNLAAMGFGAGLIALVGSVSSLHETRRHDGRASKVSWELDAVSLRLLRLEAQLAALDGSGTRAATSVGDLGADLQGLSEVVKSLAEAMAVQGRELVGLRRTVDAAAASRSPPAEARPGGQDLASIIPSFLPASGAPTPGSPRPVPRERSYEIDPVAIMSALAERQIDLHVQPIVTLPQRRPMVHDLYALLRLPDGEVLVPGQFVPTLDRLGLTAELDEHVIGRALDAARALAASDRDGILACGLSRRSLSDPAVLARIDRLVEQNEPVASRLVIEVAQRDWHDLGAAKAVLLRLRDRGVALAMAQVTDLALDPAALAAAGIRYVKVACNRLYDPDRPDEAEGHEPLSDRLARHGIRLVAERVEDDALVPELIELGVPLAQGFAFALPSPLAVLFVPKPAREPSAATLDGEDPPPDEPRTPLRRPLRSFLRRAG